MTHDKRHLAKPTILTKTRYIGFQRQPVRDDDETALISGLPAPSSKYPLLDGKRFIDCKRG